MYELKTNQTVKLYTEKQIFFRAIGWLNANEILFQDSLSTIYSYDINSNKVEQLYELDVGEQLDYAVIHENGKILLSILPPMSGINYNCKLVVIESDRSAEVILSESDRDCMSRYGQNYWFSSNGNKLIYGKDMSIYLLDLNSKKERAIFKAEDHNFFVVGWNETNDALAIIDRYSTGEVRFRLLMANSDGSVSHEIARSQNEISFYGWTRI